MMTALLIMVREGFEGALVVSILFAYLRKIDRLDLSRAVWKGVAAAVAISLGVGVVVHTTVGNLTGDNRMRAFAAIALIALAVLTWMIFWMKRQSRSLKGELEHRVHDAIVGDHVGQGLAAVALFAVLREGIEAALFLIAAATEESGRDVLLGGLAGLAIACALALSVYHGGRRLPMQLFFKVTGLVLILFAAGLASRAVLFLQVNGDLGSFSLNGVYDATSVHWLTQSSEVGKFLSAMFGWDPRPSIEQVVAYLAYVIPVTALFLRPPGSDAPPAPTAVETADPEPALL